MPIDPEAKWEALALIEEPTKYNIEIIRDCLLDLRRRISEPRFVRRQAGKINGSVRSKKKAAAARVSGLKGGRPRR